jgi:hypothetical protein
MLISGGILPWLAEKAGRGWAFSFEAMAAIILWV